MKQVNAMERFMSKVNKTDDCWIWTGGIDNDGYGLFGYRGDGTKRQWRAHRWIMHQTKGLDDSKPVVMHTCDNPSCVNPDHLINGTSKDNIHDMMKKGRSNFATRWNK